MKSVTIAACLLPGIAALALAIAALARPARVDSAVRPESPKVQDSRAGELDALRARLEAVETENARLKEELGRMRTEKPETPREGGASSNETPTKGSARGWVGGNK